MIQSEDAEAEFVRACAQATGGNPLLLEELLAELAAAGVSPSRASAGWVRELVPESVLRSVSARLLGLSADARALAAAAAVLGDGAPLRRAAAVAKLGSSEAESAADELGKAGILRGCEPLEIVHDLIRQAILAELPEFARRQARRMAAGILADDDAPIEEVCAQLLDARADADSWVVSQLRTGARAALEQAEPAGAAALLRRALAEPPDARVRPEVLIELAHAEAAAGDPAARARLEQALGLIDDPRERARALCGLSRMLFGGWDAPWVPRRPPGRALRSWDWDRIRSRRRIRWPRSSWGRTCLRPACIR